MSLKMMLAQVRKFSTTARENSNKLYELRVYSSKISNMKKLIEENRVAMPARYTHSPGHGYFFSDIGGIAEMVHIWEYESYGQRAGIRKKMSVDPSWTSKSSEMLKLLEKQDNVSMRLFPWSSLQKDVTPGGVYYLYSLTFLPTVTADTMSQQLSSFIQEADLTALGVWREELGQNVNRNAYALFHSPDHESMKNPALLSAEAWDKLNKSTSQIHGRLLTPAEWSSYQ